MFYCRQGSEITETLNKLSDLKKHDSSGGNRGGAFWKDIAATALIKNSLEIIADANNLLKEANLIIANFEHLRNDIKQNKNSIDCALFAARRIAYIAKKEILGMEISGKLNETDSPESILSYKDIKIRLNALSQEVINLKNEYKRLWNKENRLWWLDNNLHLYDSLSIDLKNKDLDVSIVPVANLDNGSVALKLQPLLGEKEIFYTLAQNNSVTSLIKYEKPIPISGLTTIKARIIDKDGRAGKLAEKTLHVHLGIGKTISLKFPFSVKYSGGGLDGLINGEKGSESFNDGRWQGYEGDDLEAIVDLKQVTDLKKINVCFLQQANSWIFMPQEVEFSVSIDGKDYQKIEKIKNDISPRVASTVLKDFKSELNVKAQYLKVHAKNIGTCPEWHPGAGGKSWIFVDEIIIE